MDTHHIHGTEVGFHGGTEEAKEFLEKNKHAAEGYLNSAKGEKEARFYVNNKEYRVEHAEVDGKDSFSVHVHHH